jgi:Na+/alanine symporter
MEGKMEVYIEWLLANAMLIIGIIIVLYGLKKVYKRQTWGITTLAIGVIIIVMFYTMEDWEHILRSFRSAWESAFR